MYKINKWDLPISILLVALVLHFLSFWFDTWLAGWIATIVGIWVLVYLFYKEGRY